MSKEGKCKREFVGYADFLAFPKLENYYLYHSLPESSATLSLLLPSLVVERLKIIVRL